jgi:hypothetical protein
MQNRNPDFSKYSLALYHQESRIFSSQNHGLRPLVECITECKGKYQNCTLHDKVVGLAAARIIVSSGIISCVITPVASKQGRVVLMENNIALLADKVVENILNNDGTAICPMEKRALAYEDNNNFFEDLVTLFQNDESSSEEKSKPLRITQKTRIGTHTRARTRTRTGKHIRTPAKTSTRTHTRTHASRHKVSARKSFKRKGTE